MPKLTRVEELLYSAIDRIRKEFISKARQSPKRMNEILQCMYHNIDILINKTCYGVKNSEIVHVLEKLTKVSLSKSAMKTYELRDIVKGNVRDDIKQALLLDHVTLHFLYCKAEELKEKFLLDPSYQPNQEYSDDSQLDSNNNVSDHHSKNHADNFPAHVVPASAPPQPQPQPQSVYPNIADVTGPMLWQSSRKPPSSSNRNDIHDYLNSVMKQVAEHGAAQIDEYRKRDIDGIQYKIELQNLSDQDQHITTTRLLDSENNIDANNAVRSTGEQKRHANNIQQTACLRRMEEKLLNIRP